MAPPFDVSAPGAGCEWCGVACREALAEVPIERLVLRPVGDHRLVLELDGRRVRCEVSVKGALTAFRDLRALEVELPARS